MHKILCLFILLMCSPCVANARKGEVGVDVFFKEGFAQKLKGKKVGLVTNHTGVNGDLIPTYELFMNNECGFRLVALFAPEHGFRGEVYADEVCHDIPSFKGVPVYSLYGKTRKPTAKMLADLDVIVYDIQDIGSRSYTYATTLFYVMEEAAKLGKPVIVLDRPNPIGGKIVDGPMLQDKWRSFLGYLNTPYCHGMTIGELSRFFNSEYKVGCHLTVIPMKGWKREMTFRDTELPWIPTSPYVPEADSPLYYATTGIIGSLSIVSIGIGYTLPFKVVGAPWIDAEAFAKALNSQKISGVRFVPFHFRPHFGLYKGEACQGVLITVTSKEQFRPLVVQYLMLGVLKTLYPSQIKKGLDALDTVKTNHFCKACGNGEMLTLLREEKYAAWKLIEYQKDARDLFKDKRKKYLLY
jgi:uncharacterized protein YbbC (DUF1343 family)